jgi:alpha,alpha-trehalase
MHRKRNTLPSPTPQAIYGQLFIDAQMRRVFEDGKSFVDARPLIQPPEALRGLYEEGRMTKDFSLSRFVQQHFAVPDERAAAGHVHSDASPWPPLVQERREAVPGDSLLPLPRPYVVPGGRHRELYYWDSYFTMLGLLADGQRGMAEDLVANFAHLLDRHGFIPNASRSYMLSRSQPPFFFCMVGLLYASDEAAGFAHFLPQLRAEHRFWMDGASRLAPADAHRRVVRLADGTLLNRYWDDRAGPREESWRDDVLTALASGRPGPEVWRDLRAAAESGWDFSSRWYDDPLAPGDRGCIHTTSILPVDLNSLLHGLESAIAAGAARAGRRALAADFRRMAAERHAALRRRFWSSRSGHFVDLDRRHPASTSRPLTAAALMPLFLGLATPAQARASAVQVRERLLGAEGLLAVPDQDGHPDGLPDSAPAGWPPLQWISVQGLLRYGQDALAREIAQRWCSAVERGQAGGGAPDDASGWTRGVYLALRRGLLSTPR